MNFIKKISPAWALRLGFGAMYAYSGVDIFLHPTAWFWAAKPVAWLLGDSSNVVNFLRSQAVVELLFAASFLGWFWPKRLVRIAAGLSALQMLAIVVFLPIDAVTFRDLGLLGGATALFLLLNFGAMVGESETISKPKPVQKNEGTTVQTFDEFMKG